MRRLSRKQAHAFWKNADSINHPAAYVGRPGYREILTLLEKYVTGDARILEIGSSVGTTLNALWLAGYQRLTGVEINPDSVALMQATYPDTWADAEILNAPVEEAIVKLGLFDVIYSKATLCHVHYDSDWVMPEIAKRARYIITVEDEHTNKSERHFPRNYRRIFAEYGFQQIEFLSEIQGLNGAYCGRVLKKR